MPESHIPASLTGIAFVALIALICGVALERLRQPAIVGYILAGLLLGPSFLGLVQDREVIDALAELGALMLLFIIGMELSLRSFKRLWAMAVVATLIQIGVSVGLMLLLSLGLGLPRAPSVVLGFALALSSTAVVIKILDDIGELRTRAGQITVGVLIAQDLAVVPIMLGISAMAKETVDPASLLLITASIAFLAGLIWLLSRRQRAEIPFLSRVSGHVDLAPLTGLAFCFGAAAITGLIGLSPAYGAFLAGIVIGNSRQRQAMLEHTRPIQSILMMVFFLSIGLLIDLDYVRENVGRVLLLLLMVAGFKTVLNVAILRMLRQSWKNAFLAGIVLAQIGEFSFLIAVTAVDAGVIGEGLHRLVVSVAALSLSLSPLWVVLARRLQSLTESGITSGSELLRGVWEPETELVAETIEEARWRGRRLARALSALRNRRGAARKALAPNPGAEAQGENGPATQPERSPDA